jgi:class 3 adenylate cyclase
VKPPKVHYAKGPEGRVAYQVLGDGPVDLVFVPFIGRNNLDVIWEHPSLERYLRRLASFSRLILLNVRGTGLSDRFPHAGSMGPEHFTTDIRTVLDDVASERCALFAVESSSPGPILFAATFPERTQALVLLNAIPTMLRRDYYPWGMPDHVYKRFVDLMVDNWGTGRNLDFMAPDVAGDERFRQWFAKLERVSASPGALEGAYDVYAAWDVRGILEAINVPTLVIAHTDVHWIRIGHGRHLAEHIPGAKYIERDAPWGGIFWLQDADWTLDEIQAFLTGTRGGPTVEDRVLATVLFTDIVDSTKRASELGDQKWRTLLDEHDIVVRREIDRFRGRPVKSTGDGFLATFDGPARAIRCALSMRDAVRELGIDIRTGLHTGEVELRGEDVGGIAVHIGARVMAEAGANEVLVSGSIPPLVAGSGLEFTDCGTRDLKGVPGKWKLYAVKG